MSRRLRRAVGDGVRAANHALSSAIDHCLGVDTTDNVNLGTLGLDKPFRENYQPAYWMILHRAFRRSEITPDDVFLDLGSGKGRIVLLAARYRFKRVTGVELSEQLTAVARRNVSACRVPMRCGGAGARQRRRRRLRHSRQTSPWSSSTTPSKGQSSTP